MTKADLVEEVSQVTELTRKDSEVIVDTLFESVIKALKTGDKLEVRGFGSFRVRQRNARVGRNPKTGEKVEVPAKARSLLQAEQGTQGPDQRRSSSRAAGSSGNPGSSRQSVDMDFIWSPWRYDYLASGGEKPSSCVFCVTDDRSSRCGAADRLSRDIIISSS